jgi:hypothetical protein
MPAYRRVGRKVLDHATGGPVRDSQCGFRALNRRAIELLAGTLEKDDFTVESEMTRIANEHKLRFADVQINCKKPFFQKESFTKETCFLRSKKVPFLAQVLSLERKCLYVCYWCLLWDIAASRV